jgi:Rhodanese-like domain
VGPESQRIIPFFGCPRKYSESSTSSDPCYIPERFEETDLLPVFAVATATSSVQKACDVICKAHHPRNPSLNPEAGKVFNESIQPLLGNLMLGDFVILQFARGYGNSVSWITDPAVLRIAKLELELHQALSSSNVIGIFGSIMQPNILFQQNNNIGVYSSMSQEHTFLSQNRDFFEAGIEFSYDKSSSPLTDEPQEPTNPPLTRVNDIQRERLTTFINLPSKVTFSLLADQSQAPQTPKQDPDTPAFFSPSFADHLPSSNHHGLQMHTVNFPLHLTTPTRSQSYPTLQSPICVNQITPQFSLKSRAQTSLRSLRRTCDVPRANISPISAQELVNLLPIRSMLLVDIRAFTAYAKSRLVDAIHVCIPTVLLKRPSLSLDDISERIVCRGDRGRFVRWKEADGIVIYDSDSLRVKDSCPLATLASKFQEAGFERPTYGLIGNGPTFFGR